MRSDLPSRVRSDFPILSTRMNGKPLVYLDNAATVQKPQCVIDAIVHYYTNDNANIHRGLYDLSQRATDAYEIARRKIAAFINAPDERSCLFVPGTTAAINLVASSWGGANLSAGDEVLVSGLEHHSNIVPWQMICERTGARLRVLYSNEDGELDLGQLADILSERTRMVSIQHISNALGTIHDVTEICRLAKDAGAAVLVDGAQWVGHYPTDVQAIGCDFYTFSGHKLYGPTGIGVLWGRAELLDRLPPYQGGGDMIETVSFERTTYAPLPNMFEAGTPHIAGAIGLGAAVDYVRDVGFEAIIEHEHQLLEHATRQLESIPGLRIVGNSPKKTSVVSFVLEHPPIAPLDVASALNREGIAIRTGHHCCMPLMNQLHLSGTNRVSMAMYNTYEEVDKLVEVVGALVASRTRQVERESESSHDKSSAGVNRQICGSSGHQVTFGQPFADTVAGAASALAEEFLEFDDHESKTELLMELGGELPRDFQTLKTLTTQVPGCMSEVYLVGRPMPDDPKRFEFAADSNAEVVRGLIAILEKLFSGQAADQIIHFDIEAFFRRIGLDQFVSTQRRSGLDGMIRRIHILAEAILERETADS